MLANASAGSSLASLASLDAVSNMNLYAGGQVGHPPYSQKPP